MHHGNPCSNRSNFRGERLVKIMSVIFQLAILIHDTWSRSHLKTVVVQNAYANECDLTGDPEFDQDEGRYHPEEVGE